MTNARNEEMLLINEENPVYYGNLQTYQNKLPQKVPNKNQMSNMSLQPPKTDANNNSLAQIKQVNDNLQNVYLNQITKNKGSIEMSTNSV